MLKSLENAAAGTSRPTAAVLDSLKYTADGLIAAIAQQYDSKEVLMMAWMNRASIEETLASSQVCYYSRSRRKLWRKGEESGHRQRLVEMHIDCDGDTLLLLVDQTGPACHTNRNTCFYLKADSDSVSVTSEISIPSLNRTDNMIEGTIMKSNEEIIRNFVAAWSRLDPEELASYFTEDGVYYNMPAQPVSGKDNIKQFIAGFIANWTRTDWDLLNICAAGDIVIAERLDRTKAGDVSVDLPCCGVFEMAGGKIKVWRDYFDMATFTKPFEG